MNCVYCERRALTWPDTQCDVLCILSGSLTIIRLQLCGPGHCSMRRVMHLSFVKKKKKKTLSASCSPHKSSVIFLFMRAGKCDGITPPSRETQKNLFVLSDKMLPFSDKRLDCCSVKSNCQRTLLLQNI